MEQDKPNNEGDAANRPASRDVPDPGKPTIVGKVEGAEPEQDSNRFLRWWNRLGDPSKVAIAIFVLGSFLTALYKGVDIYRDNQRTNREIAASATRAAAKATANARDEAEFRLRRQADIQFEVLGPDELREGQNAFTLSYWNHGSNDATAVTMIRQPRPYIGDYLGDDIYYPADERTLGTDTIRQGEGRHVIDVPVTVTGSDIRKIEERASFHGGEIAPQGAFKELSIYATIRYWDGINSCRRLNICRTYTPHAQPCAKLCSGCPKGWRNLCGCSRPILGEPEEDPPERCGHNPSSAETSASPEQPPRTNPPILQFHG